MSWLQSGGTDFSYRMNFPAANSKAVGDWKIIVPFPGWFLKTQGKIVQAAYQDVHVTASDGATELPCCLNTNKDELIIDYAAMPQGTTTLYVYYGHASCAAPTAPAFADDGGTLVDTFEGGVHGNDLGAPWVLSGSPTVHAYSNEHPAIGSLGGKITARAANWDGIKETTSLGMTANTAEYRFWLYLDTLTKYRAVSSDGLAANQCVYIRFNIDGTMSYYTDRGAPGYYVLGTYAVGLFEYRVIHNFTANTYSLSRRSSRNALWTVLKSDIPFRGTNAITQTSGMDFVAYDGGSLWLDDVRYADAGMSGDVLTVEATQPNDERTGEADTDSRNYFFGSDIDATYLDSANAATCYNNAVTHLAGITAAGVKYHQLLKHFEGALPKGMVSACTLYLYLESNVGILEALTLKLHRFRNNTGSAGFPTSVAAGWSCQSTDAPTWTRRFYDWQQAAAVNWQTAGATGADEIQTEGTEPTLALGVGASVGYKTFAIPAAWIQDGQGDLYSNGFLIKDATEAGMAANRYAQFTAPNQINNPVLEIVYSALDADQLLARKLSTDAYMYATFPTQDRFCAIPTANGFGVMCWVNTELKADLAYISSEGSIRRIARNLAPAIGRLSNNSPLWGLYYDPDEFRYWIAGNDSATKLCIAYSEPYTPDNIIWSTHATEVAAKSVIMPKNGMVHILYYNYSTSQLKYTTFTRATGVWGAVTVLAAKAVGGTQRTLSVQINAGDVMNGAGIIETGGALTDYPAFGAVKIDSEYFWYTGKSGQNLTGVTRAAFGSAAAQHLVGATVAIDRGDLTYSAIAYDAVKACIHVVYCVNSTSPNFAYLYTGYMRHYFADPAGTWKDEAGNVLTLPIDNRNERQVGSGTKPSYCPGVICLDNGDFLAALDLLADITQYGASNMTDGRVVRLANAGTFFVDTDFAPDLQECSFVDLGSGDVVMSGLDSATRLRMQTHQSEDYGATFDAEVRELCAHSFPAGALWNSSISEQGNLDGNGIMYAQHVVWHGAVFLDAVALASAITILPDMRSFERRIFAGV